MSNRLRITTPKLYEQLKNGDFDTKYHVINVEHGAEADLLTDPKRFATASFTEIRFSDKKGNRVNISPARSSVFAMLESGGNLVDGLPFDYKEYFVRSRKTSTISPESFSYMLTWTNATKFEVYDNQDIAYDLIKNIDGLKEFKHLETLSDSAQQKSYKKLHLATFWDNLPGMTNLNVYAVALNDDEFKEFVAGQSMPNGWTVQVINRAIHYRKH